MVNKDEKKRGGAGTALAIGGLITAGAVAVFLLSRKEEPVVTPPPNGNGNGNGVVPPLPPVIIAPPDTPPEITHTECVNGKCLDVLTLVGGETENQCTQNSDCVTIEQLPNFIQATPPIVSGSFVLATSGGCTNFNTLIKLKVTNVTGKALPGVWVRARFIQSKPWLGALDFIEPGPPLFRTDMVRRQTLDNGEVTMNIWGITDPGKLSAITVGIIFDVMFPDVDTLSSPPVSTSVTFSLIGKTKRAGGRLTCIGEELLG